MNAVFKRHKNTAVDRPVMPPVGFPEGGHLLVTGQSGSGKTRLIRELIWFGYFGRDASIRVVTDFAGAREYAGVADRLVSVGGGQEAMVAATAATRAVMHYRRSRLETVPAPLLTPEVLVLDIPSLIGRLTHPAGPPESIRPTLEMLQMMTLLGQENGIRVVLAAHSSRLASGPRRGLGHLRWFVDRATVVTVDYPLDREVRIEQTAQTATG